MEIRRNEPGVDRDVEAAVAGDADALERVLSELGPQVQRSLKISERWGRLISAEDVMQVTYMEAFLRIGSLTMPTAAGAAAWLKRIGENNLRDAVKELSRLKRPDAHNRLTTGAEGESARTLIARLAEEAPGAATMLAGKDAVRHLYDAIDQLPASYREVIMALDIEEQPGTDFAEATGRSPGAVYMLHTRAHDRLRDLMNSDELGQ